MYPTIKNILILLLPLLLSFSRVEAQGPAIDNIGNAIRKGDVGGIARYFSNAVDITINNAQSTYSKTQGELVLRDFFYKNPPRDFEIEHANPSSSANGMFAIGNLNTATGRFRVYIFLRQKDNIYTLKEIRFEK